MKAISLWQPWASLVAFGEKKVETRCWTTKYRGSIAIASTKQEPKWDLGASRHGQEFTRAMIAITERHGWGEFYWPKAYWKPLHDRYDHLRENTSDPTELLAIDLHAAHGFGAVLCTADLVAIEETLLVRADLSEQELLFGNYEDGRYAWFLENVKRFEAPIPVKGNRMLWNWDPASPCVDKPRGE